MSMYDSMKSPDFEYIYNRDTSVVASLERKAINNLHISEHSDSAGCTWKQDYTVAMEITNDIFDVDNNHKDPQLCATLACGIYNHLHTTEVLGDDQKRVRYDRGEDIEDMGTGGGGGGYNPFGGGGHKYTFHFEGRFPDS